MGIELVCTIPIHILTDSETNMLVRIVSVIKVVMLAYMSMTVGDRRCGDNAMHHWWVRCIQLYIYMCWCVYMVSISTCLYIYITICIYYSAYIDMRSSTISLHTKQCNVCYLIPMRIIRRGDNDWSICDTFISKGSEIILLIIIILINILLIIIIQ